MKKIYALLFCAFQVFAFSQSQDLAKLASGEHLGFNALFDSKDNLFGYVSLYGYGKSGEKAKKFEYVILDKNLNPIANKEFEGDITASSFAGYMDYNNKIILRPKTGLGAVNVFNYSKFAPPRTKEIDLKSNTVKDKDFYEYENGKFKLVTEPASWGQERKDDRLEKKEKGYNYRSFVFDIKEGGFLALEFNDYGSYINNNSLMRFDENQKQLWKYKYNISGDKKINEEITILEKDENYIYILSQINNKKEKDFSLVVLDMKTGKEIHKKPINSLKKNTLDKISSFRSSDSGNLTNDKTFDDKIVMVGRDIDDNNRYVGFARLIIDRKTFAVDTKTISYESLKPQIPKLDKNGGVEDNYFLDPRDLFILKDGSIGFLLEKYKVSVNQYYTKTKTTDLVYIFTDSDFVVKDVSIFDKAKSKWGASDYLFSQYLNDSKDVVFYYRDYQKDDETKEKNWNLFINTLIDGKFKQEMIPISSKKQFFVAPYVGKEGYILLREYNEKEKFNSVRLERLNY